MKVALSIIWFIFTILFLGLGIAHWQEIDNQIPPFIVPEFKVGDGTIKISSGGQEAGLEEPVKVFVKDFNDYLKEQNKANAKANRRAALGYFAAAFTALISLFLVWKENIQRCFKKTKSAQTG